MVLRLQVWAGFTVTLIACTGDAERCERLLALAAAQVSTLARGCTSAAECRPLAGACGAAAAVLATSDTREATRTLERFEQLCGCPDAGPALLPVACIAGQCRPRAEPLPRPALCEDLRVEMQREIDRQNRCASDRDCTAFNVLTCPPVCGRPTALTAEPERVAALLLDYNRIEGCRDCEPTCTGTPATRCFSGLCAAEAAVARDCATVREEMLRLAANTSCLAYADCARVSFGRVIDGACSAAMARADAPRVAELARTWDERCCQGCALCDADVDSARCDARRCIPAEACPRRLRDGPRGWTLTYRVLGPNERTLLVRSDGLGVLSPPGVQGLLRPPDLAQLTERADTAALLCLDDSFHRNAEIGVEITATVPDVGLVALRYGTAVARPSGLAELERALEAVAARLRAGP